MHSDSLVVYGRKNWDGLLGDIDTGENGSSLRDTWETLVENVWGKVGELQEDMVLVRSNTSSFSDLERHRSRNDITRSQILCGRGVSFHKSFTLRVEQVSTFTSRTLSDQTTGTVNTGRVELDKLQILQRKTSSNDHSVSVTGTSVGRGT